MKPVLISIQRPHTDNIKALLKTIEVRKGRPNQDTPFPCYIYETKAKGGCGKVIGEFVCDRIYNITPHEDIQGFVNQYITDWEYGTADECLTFDEMNEYLKGKNGYGWHISDLVIYDKPKELCELAKWCNGLGGNIGCTGCEYFYSERNASIGECRCNHFRPIERPPQSWCYVEELEDRK